jgi:hypothetical protein
MKESFVSLATFASAPLGTLVVSLLLFRYLLDTGECGKTATDLGGLGKTTCTTRIGIEVPYTFDPFLAASLAASGLALAAGGIAAWLRTT